MPLKIIRNDITKVKADAIVNAANPNVTIGSGVDATIYKAAGKDALLLERKKIGVMHPGEVAETPAFNLHAKYIIHAIGPVWKGGTSGEVDTVAQCYRKSLEKAKELECESIAFPLLASGTYGFPKDIALKTAISEISGFLFNHDMTVYLVVYDKESFEVSGTAFNDISSVIKEEDIVEPLFHRREIRYGNKKSEILHAKELSFGSTLSSADLFKVDMAYTESEEEALDEDIKDIIRAKEETFQEHLFRLIDRKGLEDKDVYKKANIDRKHFSKIRGNVNYNPSKRTALALAVALELNLDETKDLLLRAGIALSKSNIFDLIVEYCIDHKIFDIYEINCILFKYDQQTLGA
ncbi:MAG: macro domain-containing protein [Solobacterium sp.]|nr:macro domain-containing protein [Solobacterium sp.]